MVKGEEEGVRVVVDKEEDIETGRDEVEIAREELDHTEAVRVKEEEEEEEAEDMVIVVSQQ